MFKLVNLKSVKWPVEVHTPRDGGETVKGTFNAEFRILDNDEFAAIYDHGGKDVDMIKKTCIGWDQKLCDENGDPIPFSEEQLDLVLNKPYVRNAFVTAYIDCSSGKAARKN
jgi:hypothetical protein